MSRAPDFLLLQHIPDGCPPDAYEAELATRGVQITRVRPQEGERLPDWRDFDALLVMGGPMSAFDDHRHPWLRDERELIRDAVVAGLPYWGVCLGSQMLAASLGGKAYRAPQPEVGVKAIALTAAGRESPIFAGCPGRFETLEWHRDTYNTPPGAISLADSAMYGHQAFSWGNACGIQFHQEPSLAVLEHWIGEPNYDLSDHKPEAPQEELLRDLTRVERQMTAIARRMLSNWMAASRYRIEA